MIRNAAIETKYVFEKKFPDLVWKSSRLNQRSTYYRGWKIFKDLLCKYFIEYRMENELLHEANFLDLSRAAYTNEGGARRLKNGL